MSKRLKMIYSLLPNSGRGIIDVGTDHGLIPIQLIKDHYPGMVFASDIVPGPLNAARRAAESEGVAHKIQFFLCDGLDLCPPEHVDCILIAGMGGDSICRILDRAEWLFSDSYQLVLQPMTHPEVVRYWLIHNDYAITQEAIAVEDSQVYQIIKAEPGKTASMKDFEYYIGSRLLPRAGGDLLAVASNQLVRINKKIDGLLQASRKQSEKIAFYQSIQTQLKQYINSCSGKN